MTQNNRTGPLLHCSRRSLTDPEYEPVFKVFE